MDLGNAYRRSPARRLDEERQAELAFQGCQRRDGTLMDRHRTRHWQARCPQQALGDVLVERCGGAEDAATGEWNAGHLRRALH